MDAILGVDVGTGSLKAGLFSLNGDQIGFAAVGYRMSSPEPDAMEEDPDDWWRAFIDACQQLTREGRDWRVAAVCIGGMAPVLCAVDAELRPTYPAIIWLDHRPALEAERIYGRLGRPVPVWGSWPAQVAWLAHQRPAVLRKTRWLIGCPDYLSARLTGRLTSFLAWPDDEIEAAEIDRNLVAPTVEPGSVVGPIRQSAAELAGLPAGIPVVAGYVDGIMGVLGSGVSRPGDASLSGGTSGTFSMVTDTDAGYPVMGLSIVGAASNTSGKALDWFVERIAAPGSSYLDLLAAAAEVVPGSLGLLFLPHLAGERAPVRDPRARGAWVGLTLEHDARHLLRSVLEGVAFSFRALHEHLAVDCIRAREVRVIGGQARSRLWNRIKADVLNLPVLVPQAIEGPVVGAAILGAIGLGAYRNREEAVEAMVHIAHRLEPDPAAVAVYDELFATYQQLYPRLS
jgi:xylulokinase